MYISKFIKKDEVAKGTERFWFEKPKDFEYIAGQSIDLTIPHIEKEDKRGNMRPFTLSSAPFEENLFVTTRMTGSGFKNTLLEMEEGSELHFEGPFGDLILHENKMRTAVFLAGGIGITPFYSIIKQAINTALPHKMILFYSNRRPEDAPYLADLKHLEKENRNFIFVATMTEMELSKEDWAGETGYIDEKMLQKYIPQDANPIYYLAGPSPMVKGMRALLNSIGVSNDDIRTEEFTGY